MADEVSVFITYTTHNIRSLSRKINPSKSVWPKGLCARIPHRPIQ